MYVYIYIYIYIYIIPQRRDPFGSWLLSFGRPPGFQEPAKVKRSSCAGAESEQFKSEGLGFGVWGLGFGVECFEVQGFGFGV